MNFFKYQNFSNRNVNIEVPLVTDPRSNILQTLYSQSNDEIWIESWLQQNSVYKPIPKVKITKGDNITIREAQNSLKESLILLDKLSKVHQDMLANVDSIPSTDWKQKTLEIGTMKDRFTKLMSKFENGEGIFALKKALDKRKKKRINNKKKKEFRKQQIEEKLLNRAKLHQAIDEWLVNKQEEVEKCKMEENMKKDADCVLAEVTKKKSDARKQLALIGALTKLRAVREQMALHRGEKISAEDTEVFRASMEKLRKMWEDSLKTYTTEEQGLKLMLEKTAVEDSKTTQLAKERKLLDEWHTVFFGPRQLIPPDNTMYWALTAAERDMETFVAIRKSWDTFLVPSTNEMGSSIPIGWVLPDRDAGENWTKYLSNA
nr:unnamed protein product [Callosobruchus analis]